MSSTVVALLATPLIIFMVLVAPMWLVLHYRSKRQISQGLSQQEREELEHLAQQAQKMSVRIHTLEQILDSESPNWRNRHD